MFNYSAQFQNPNPQNPNYSNQVPYRLDQFHDSPYFRIAKYLLSDEDEGSDENFFWKKEDVSEIFISNRSDDASSDPVPLSRNVKCKRELKKYKIQGEIIRFGFRTKTDLEFMDDGYKWIKYGKKKIKSSPNPRNYFKCSSGGCNVKKRVERDSDDPRYVITTYHGMHNHEIP